MKQSLITQQRGHISQIFVLSTMQFYPKGYLVLPMPLLEKGE